MKTFTKDQQKLLDVMQKDCLTSQLRRRVAEARPCDAAQLASKHNSRLRFLSAVFVQLRPHLAGIQTGVKPQHRQFGAEASPQAR